MDSTLAVGFFGALFAMAVFIRPQSALPFVVLAVATRRFWMRLAAAAALSPLLTVPY